MIFTHLKMTQIEVYVTETEKKYVCNCVRE